MKIDDLVANLERNAQEQDKIMTEKIQSVTSQHLASYNELLQSNLKATQKILSDQQASIQAKLNTALAFKNWLMITIGELLAIILVMGLAALWTYKSLKDMRAEQAQIQATIDQMPLPPKVLNQFNIQQDEKFLVLCWFVIAILMYDIWYIKSVSI